MESYLFDVFTSRFIIRGKLVALTGLHIGGSQGGIEPAATDSTVIKDVYGRPYIPGSSLKGVMRAFTERVIPMAFGAEVCDIFDKDNSCSARINAEKRKRIESQGRNEDLSPQEIYEHSCAVCRIYGNQALAGRLMVKDALLMPGSWEHGVYDVRDGVGIDRDSNTAADKAKYDYEVVPAGVEFQFEAIADNVDEESWSYILVTLMAMARGNITIGGLSSRGLGRVKLEDVTITKIYGDDLKAYLLKGQGGKVSSLEQEAEEVFKDHVQTA